MKKRFEDLREKAQKLLEEAEKLEKKRIFKMGLLVSKLEKNKFKDFDLSKFKTEVAAI